jgi:hypothetical protein
VFRTCAGRDALRDRTSNEIEGLDSSSCSSSSFVLRYAGVFCSEKEPIILFRYSDCETSGFFEDEDDDEYPGKPRLFWVRHEH